MVPDEEEFHEAAAILSLAKNRTQGQNGPRKHFLFGNDNDEELGNVSAPAQVLNAVPETLFSALRNSA
jgi:hypothetical protein